MAASDENARAGLAGGPAGSGGAQEAVALKHPADEASAAGTDLLDPQWVVRLTRSGFVLALIAQVAYIVENHLYLDRAATRIALPYSLFTLAAASFASAISFTPAYGRYWKPVTLFLCLSLVGGWTCITVLVGQQVQMFAAVLVLLTGASALAPWDVRWQAALTAGCMVCCAINAALVPTSPYLGYLWLDVISASALTLASTRLWERWRSALADTNRRLQGSETRLKTLLDANIDPVSVVRLSDGRYIYVNDEGLKRGYSREEILGQSVGELGLWADEKTDLAEFAKKVRVQGFVRNEEINIRMGDGRVAPHLLSSVLVHLDGEPCILSVARDITDLKQVQRDLTASVAELKETQRRLRAEIEERERIIVEREEAEKRLQESEAKLRQVFDASPDVISIISAADGRMFDVNDAVLATGFTREQALNWRPEKGGIFVDPKQRDELLQMLHARGKVRNLEVAFRTRKGTVVPCLVSAVLVEMRGEPCVISFTRDITELKKTERELIAAREAALGASSAKSEFLSNMSHEIRTPMNAILGMADLLAETRLSAEQQRYVEIMTSNGNALLDLINGILDLAKVESGRLHLEETEFDLDELVERVAETLSMRAHEKGIELATRIAPGTPLRLFGDPLRLRQVLVNLVGNAIKFTEQGEVLLTVEDDAEEDEPGFLRFSVSDTGIGIPPEKLEAIFQTFTQADSSTTRRYGGSGLGLSIAKRLVELMGGRIEAESKIGKGSVFHFRARLGGQAAVANQDSSAGAIRLEGLRVLVADDSAANRLILRETLVAQGAKVGEAGGGAQALAEAERARAAGAPYRLVLLDCTMPRMDGFQVAEQLRRHPGEASQIIFMLTSDDLNAKLLRLRELGIGTYVIKPVKRAELWRAIAIATGKALMVEAKPAQPPQPELPAVVHPARILLAEDSPHNRVLIEEYLKKLPYQLDTAENGEVAVGKFVRGHYDLVLMDVRMPVMDGYTAVRKIRQWEREQNLAATPIVALTASALEEDVRNSLDAGCTTHLSKPVKKSRLLAMIRELTNRTTTSPVNGDGAKQVAELDSELENPSRTF